ncbi:MAG TPA: polysaccharide deacetylase family protein [Gammaproteobacteria bacterium]|nr:polysaccharide deacetylase family protein [Chromatiales bacterium]HPQ24713.1 polysaccharide deacetylase family protein [Gammaproteobacteria bacterium]
MTFGAMFHHFHDAGMHRRGQGSLSADGFRALLGNLSSEHNILVPGDYVERARAGALSADDICLSFDDALLCQYDVAVPVLDEFGIKAFFFVYSSIFTDTPDSLELYRDFRNASFDDIEDFYRAFFEELAQRLPRTQCRYADTYPADYLADFGFYTDNDRRFRFVRDQVLTQGEYDHLMTDMMDRVGYPREERKAQLWMTAQHVAELDAAGHEIGLHSHSHPMQMRMLDRAAQEAEYRLNRRMLGDICGRPPRTMSHPCGSYNDDTLDVLRNLGIVLGFRSNMSPVHGGSLWEMPREDHANLMHRAT